MPGAFGRQKNETLAIGYLIDAIRYFAGRCWIPTRVEFPGSPPHARAQIEALYRCEISSGNIACVLFPDELLDIRNPKPHRLVTTHDVLPTLEDFTVYVRHLIRLGLLERRPQRAWVARRLHVSVRTMQRRLKEHGTSFAEVWRSVTSQQPIELLKHQEFPISEIAYELGYADPAHFARAFNNWFGKSPHVWRRENAALPPIDNVPSEYTA